MTDPARLATPSRNQFWISRAASILLVGYGAAVFAIMMIASQPRDVADVAMVLPFFVWALAPIAVISIFAYRARRPGIAVFSALVMALTAVSGVYIYVTGMFRPDARSTAPLVFLFLPLYQWAAPAILACAVGIGALAGTLSKHD